MVVKTCVAGRIYGVRLLTKITTAPLEQISFEKKGENLLLTTIII